MKTAFTAALLASLALAGQASAGSLSDGTPYNQISRSVFMVGTPEAAPAKPAAPMAKAVSPVANEPAAALPVSDSEVARLPLDAIIGERPKIQNEPALADIPDITPVQPADTAEAAPADAPMQQPAQADANGMPAPATADAAPADGQPLDNADAQAVDQSAKTAGVTVEENADTIANTKLRD